MARKKKSNSTGLWVAVIVGMLGVSGVAAYVVYGPGPLVPDELRRSDPVIDVTVDSTPIPGEAERTVLIITPEMNEDGEMRFARRTENISPGEDPVRASVDLFVRRTKIAPEETRLLGLHVGEDGLAALSFNAALVGGYGSAAEAAFIEGLRRTLGQFKRVEAFQILVDGEVIESLGHFEIAGPITVVRDGDVPAEDSMRGETP